MDSRALTDDAFIRFFLVGNLADEQEEIVRIAGLLRGTESAAQAVSVRSTLQLFFLWSQKLTFDVQYGLSSISIMAAVGNPYLNFGLWGLAIIPSWFIVKEVGHSFGDKKIEREARALRSTFDNQ